ncbi:hypothetical protein FBU59_001234 [Linderina macrospora]|uniref:Uncharacterized protein n=1 Tax=Linderina macrospora TaxID=4868 RepID=A0ACC1JED8_9FUNG|nr:hypothetical protein FBU59_001234 [Linderina macrospora]
MASNLGQIAVFQARSLGLKEVWFAGGFVAHPVVKRAVGEAVGFWAQGTIEARFVGQETTLGALGALYAQ